MSITSSVGTGRRASLARSRGYRGLSSIGSI